MANNNELISFNVTKSLWRLNRSANGWQKEVNLVAWNGKKPRLDVREWNMDKTKMRRGVTFSKDEVLELRKCLNNIDIDWLYQEQPEASSQTEPGPADPELAENLIAKASPPEEESEILLEAQESFGGETADCTGGFSFQRQEE